MLQNIFIDFDTTNFGLTFDNIPEQNSSIIK